MAIYSLGKINVLRIDLNESREGFCRRGRGRSFQVEGPKTEKAREPTLESLVRGISVEAESIRSREESTGGCVKLKTVTTTTTTTTTNTPTTTIATITTVIASLLLLPPPPLPPQKNEWAHFVTRQGKR